MGERFSQDDWEFVLSRAAQVTAQLRAKGANADDLKPLPPVSSAQVTDFEQATGLSLPEDFVDLVTKYAGGWYYRWCLAVPRRDKPWLSPERRLKSPVFMGNFGGNGAAEFIDARQTRPLVQIYTEFQAELYEDGLTDPEMKEIARKSFPLHFYNGVGGDRLVLRLDVTPARVCFLSHEAGWVFRDDFIMCEGFREFVIGWAAIGFPECRRRTPWVDAEQRRPISSGTMLDTWLAWLDDPSAA